MVVALEMSSFEQPYGQGRRYFENIVSLLNSGKGCEMDLSELERELKKRGQELMRILLQEHLDRAASPGRCDEPVSGADGVERPRVRLQERKAETVFGTVQASRAGYGQEGVNSLHPLDAELNLPPERYSLELRRLVAEEAAKNSFDETLETIAKTTAGHIPKRQVEELAKRAAQDFDDFYAMRQCKPGGDDATGPVLVITADGKGVDVTIIVDIIHVIEYLWKAGRAFHPKSGPELENWVRHRLLGVLQGKAGLMAGGMRLSATRKQLSSEARKPVDTCATYLLNKSPYLHYDRYLSLGFPIATGVIEGACRHLVKDRMEITGAKWRLPGAKAVLRLRALRSSNDFDEYK